ncbi:peptidylprolyl isomerase [Candidatus Pacearchaeota archaeon]|nr:peptidylprolyl isomerase [Candidatus Pacearchaeota archaeon]
MEVTQKNDFIALRFTGYANGELFDSNRDEDAKKLGSTEEPKEAIVVIGQGMVVRGLDKALEGKEIGKEYEVEIDIQEGFGERKRELVKTIPLKVFSEKNVHPRPGMMLALDDMLVKIIAVSGARVITDFNNPLAGKNLKYKFSISRVITDEQEKVKSLCTLLFKFVPEFSIDEKIILRGPKPLGMYIQAFSSKFKELLGKELLFEEKIESPTVSEKNAA